MNWDYLQPVKIHFGKGRVKEIKEIARELGWSKKEILNLKNAAYLHDVGKIGIPDTILNKPSRLSDDEYALIKAHTVIGADILKGITMIEHVADVAR